MIETTRALGRPVRHAGLGGRLLSPFFARVRLDGEAVERLREAHQRGVVVHVLRARRVIDPLYILYALRRLGLPEPEWMHDHFASRRPPGVAELCERVSGGSSSLLFLRRPRTLMSPSGAYSERHVEALVGLQRQLDRPILLLPETVLWTKRAAGLERTIIDSIFGDREDPGVLRELLGFFWHHADSRFHVGAPIDVSAVLEREKGQTDRVIAKKIRWAILHHLSREEQLRTGPMHRSAARTRQMVLNDPAVRRYFGTQSKLGAKPEELEKRANDLLKTISADMRYGWLRVLDAVVDLIWHRIYDGIEVDQEGLAKVRRAARKGPVVLVPSHKSHIDYLVLSQVFFKDGMMPPHVAAGDNLNFPPIGFIFRRSGAFFIRRSFKGDKLYAVVFSAYVRRLMKEGHAVEFFIEGGRSRTGKLLPPRMGMLSMCVDPVLDGAVSDVQFIPVSIGYEKLIEAKSYAKELQGEAKKKEDMGALLSSTKVLRSRYGRVYVDFGEPVSLRVFAASRGFDLPARPELSDAASEEEVRPERKALIAQLGHRIVNGIYDVSRVTPTNVAALVLLARSRRGMAEGELYRRADRVLDLLDELAVRQSALLSRETRRAALREALGRFAADGLVLMTPAPDGETIYQNTDAGRLALDYYKNNIVHLFVPLAVAAAAVRIHGGEEVPEALVLLRARRLSHLLKHEVSFRVERSFEDNFRHAAEILVARRTLGRRGEAERGSWTVTPNGRAEAAELSGLLAVWLEAYRLVAETLATLEGPTPSKRFVTLALAQGRRQVLEGRMLRAEGASQPTIQSALQLLADDGIVGRGGEVEVTNEVARSALVEELSGYLRNLSGDD